jgi:hypothetical protein
MINQMLLCGFALRLEPTLVIPSSWFFRVESDANPLRPFSNQRIIALDETSQLSVEEVSQARWPGSDLESQTAFASWTPHLDVGAISREQLEIQ